MGFVAGFGSGMNPGGGDKGKDLGGGIKPTAAGNDEGLVDLEEATLVGFAAATRDASPGVARPEFVGLPFLCSSFASSTFSTLFPLSLTNSIFSGRSSLHI